MIQQDLSIAAASSAWADSGVLVRPGQALQATAQNAVGIVVPIVNPGGVAGHWGVNFNYGRDSLSLNITSSTAPQQVLVVRVASLAIYDDFTGSAPTLSSVTLGSQNFTFLRRDTMEQSVTDADGSFNTEYSVEVWYLVAPNYSSLTVTLNWSIRPLRGDICITCYSGVNQSSPIDSSTSFLSTEFGSISNSLTTTGKLAYLLDTVQTVNASYSEVPGAAQTLILQDYEGAGQYHSDRAVTGLPGSYSMSWSSLVSGPYQQTIVGLAPAASYALPEGAYPPTFPKNPDYNPSLVLPDSALTPAQQAALTCPLLVPYSLSLAFVQDGAGPPPSGATYPVSPDRATTYSASQIQSLAVGGTGPWRVWLIFNTFDYTTPTGSYAVQLEVLFPQGAFDMSDRFSVLNVTQMGMESTPGTPVAATKRILAFTVKPKIMTKFKKHRTEGYKRGDLAIAAKEWTEASIEGIACYNHLPLLFSSLISVDTPATVSTGVYSHYQQSNDRVPDSLKSFTVEHGSAASSERFGFGMVSEVAFKSTRDDINISGSMYGQILADSVNNQGGYTGLSTGVNEQQSVTITGATGGTFALTFRGQTTAALAYNATTAAVQTALQALSTIGTGNAIVGGSAGAYSVTFQGALAGMSVSSLIANGTLLTGSSPTAVVVVTQQGGLTELSKIPVMPGDFTLYVASSWAGLGTSGNIVTRQFETDLTLGKRSNPFWTQNAANASWTGFAEGEPTEGLDIMQGVDSAYQLRHYYQQGQLFYVRLSFVSQQFTIGSSGVPYSWILDAAVAIDSTKEYKDEEGVYAYGYNLGFKRDPIAGVSYYSTITNGIAAYTS